LFQLTGHTLLPPTTNPALIAIDLGAESCRVSLLRFVDATPHIMLVHRFPNAPITRGDEASLHWDITAIEVGVNAGLKKAADLAPEGIRSIAVDGWAVDYVRLGHDGNPLAEPFCYRDLRTVAAEQYLHRHLSPERMRQITAITSMRINTLYQLHADRLTNLPPGRGWLNLPEYILFRLGGRPVSEQTNAAHSQLVDVDQRTWSHEIFSAADLEIAHAPNLVPPGTDLGQLTGPLAALPAYANTRLIAPACHDTASAIAGIPAFGDDWAYISSGTWSLVGALIPAPIRTAAAGADGFTNFAGAGGLTCFHVNVNGMWLLRQSMHEWEAAGRTWDVADLVAAAESEPTPAALINVDEPELLLPGDMLHRINAQLQRAGHPQLDQSPENAPAFASLIFHSLAARYAQVLAKVSAHTGKQLKRLFIVGGANRNLFLNRLTAQATGLEVLCGSPESSTIGNFAIQLAVFEGHSAPTAEQISRHAADLASVVILPG
jgi:rhamnulokinase